jgi:hypothetical protein
MLGVEMSEEVVVIKTSTTRRRAIEGSIGVLAGLTFACLNGPWLLSWLYKPLSSGAISCGPAVDDALSYFVRVQIAFGLGGGALLLVASFFFRRALRKRREGAATT